MGVRVLLAALALVGSMFVGAGNATAAEAKGPSNLEVEQALERLGLPVGKVDGTYSAHAKRALCAWRHAMGRPTNRNLPTPAEEAAIVATTSLPKPLGLMVTGLNVNQRCQTLFWVRGKGDSRRYVAVFGVSTGTYKHPTRIGTFRIQWQKEGFVESNIYSGAFMWRPKFFSGGMALHGSRSDSLIFPWPASHGCVRMYHKDINRLWDEGVGVGTRVKVYSRF